MSEVRNAMLDSTLRGLRLAYVPRWTTVPMLRPQSVAEHSFRVAFIVRHLARVYGLNEAREVHQAIAHDLDESTTGDIPSNMKVVTKHHPPLLRLADKIEAYTWLKKWGLPNIRQIKILGELGDKINTITLEIGGAVPQYVDDLIKAMEKGE